MSAVSVGGGRVLRADFDVGRRRRRRTDHVVVHVVQVIVRFVDLDVGVRLGLAAAPEVEPIDASAQVRAVHFGARVREHANARLAGPPAHARQLPDVPSEICGATPLIVRRTLTQHLLFV
jgi:hypothetical protein